MTFFGVPNVSFPGCTTKWLHQRIPTSSQHFPRQTHPRPAQSVDPFRSTLVRHGFFLSPKVSGSFCSTFLAEGDLLTQKIGILEESNQTWATCFQTCFLKADYCIFGGGASICVLHKLGKKNYQKKTRQKNSGGEFSSLFKTSL